MDHEDSERDNLCSTEEYKFKLLIALIVISALQIITGVAAVISTSFKIRRWCRGEPDDDDEKLDPFRVIGLPRSSHPPTHQENHQIPHGARPAYDNRYDPYMGPGYDPRRERSHDPRRGRSEGARRGGSNDPYVYYINKHGGATYYPGMVIQSI
ncbi:uncharacterized protein [Amphiura filiformis]|uniref:uncharacterized protein n=1 Tax=Amphiura filiformis TaxID=82378 RepID=UPI003B20B9AC